MRSLRQRCSCLAYFSWRPGPKHLQPSRPEICTWHHLARLHSIVPQNWLPSMQHCSLWIRSIFGSPCLVSYGPIELCEDVYSDYTRPSSHSVKFRMTSFINALNTTGMRCNYIYVDTLYKVTYFILHVGPLTIEWAQCVRHLLKLLYMQMRIVFAIWQSFLL